MANYKLFQGDNNEVMPTMKAHSVDAIITDTPYGTDLAKWDNLPTRDQFQEMYRLAKPGAYVAAFGAPRTVHKLMNVIEGSGFEIKDMLLWLYGSGFAPGSNNVAESIDNLYGEKGVRDGAKYTPASPEAKEFEGFGVGLKPAWEPIVLARKPGMDTVAENLVTHGVGALDISSGGIVDGLIYGATDADNESVSSDIAAFREKTSRSRRRIPGQKRWPSNVSMDVEAAAFVEGLNPGAARFFFCGKTSPSEREAGCEKITAKTVEARRKDSNTAEKRNIHPTVKPIALMRWLTRLVAPPGSVVLDPFMGSGSTGCAVGQEGKRFFLGIEMMPEFFEIAEARVEHWSTLSGGL
jgi:DNA modification methylase